MDFFWYLWISMTRSCSLVFRSLPVGAALSLLVRLRTWLSHLARGPHTGISGYIGIALNYLVSISSFWDQ